MSPTRQMGAGSIGSGRDAWLRAVNWGLVALALFSFVMGSTGWYVYYLRLERDIDVWLSLFYGLQLFTLNSSFPTTDLPLPLNIARFTAPASLAGAIINGVIFVTRNNYRFMRIRLFSGHIVICGASRRARALVRDLLRDHGDERVVVVDERSDLEDMEEFRGPGVALLGGSPVSGFMLRKAGIARARLVLLLDDDTRNLATLERLGRMGYAGKTILHLSDRRAADIYKEMSKRLGVGDMHVISDQALLSARLADRYSPDRFVKFDCPAAPPAHILLAGDDPIILGLIREAGIIWHFANQKKLECTVLTADAESWRAMVEEELPNAHRVMNLHFLSMSEMGRLRTDSDMPEVSVGLVCARDFARGFDLSRRLRQELVLRRGCLEIPKLVLLESLDEDAAPVVPELLGKLEPLGVEYFESSREFSAKAVIFDTEIYDVIAKHIHNAFSVREVSKASDVDAMWNALSDAERDWNRWPARHFHVKLRHIGARIAGVKEQAASFDLGSLADETREVLARMEKRRWDAEKWLTGYVPGDYQEDKSLEIMLKRELKVHPALKPWEEISDEERVKDRYAFNDIEEILKTAGLKIVAVDDGDEERGSCRVSTM